MTDHLPHDDHLDHEPGFGHDLDDELLEAWSRAERGAAAFVRAHLAERRHTDPPPTLTDAAGALRDALRAGDPDADWMRAGAGVAADLTWPGAGPVHPEDLLWQLVAATISLREDPGLRPEEQAALLTLEPVDWAGAIVGLVRAGAGTGASAEALVDHLAGCPDIDGELDPGEADVLEEGFGVALRGWRVAGMVDRGDRLTEAGAWLLPRAACLAWETDFDHPDDDLGDDDLGEDDLGEDDLGEDDPLDLHGLGPRGREGLGLLLSIHQGALLGAGTALEDPMVAEAAVEALAWPGVAGAFAADALGVGRDTDAADALERVARLALDAARGRDAASAHYLLARVAEIRGETAAGQTALDRALALDPDHEAALDDASWYAEDRGDHAKVLAYLRRLEVDPDDPQRQRMEALAAGTPRDVGRNEPCPCGSGRKFKACCLRTGGVSLVDRLPFLLTKLDVWVQRPARRPHLFGLAVLAAGSDDARLVRRLRDPLVLRLALFDGDLLDDFVRERGPLLPEDERELVAGWTEVRIGCFEVTGVVPGSSLSLLDLVTGDRFDVRERTGSRTLGSGATLLAHPLPIGEAVHLGVAMSIDEASRPGLVALLSDDPEPADLARWIGELADAGGPRA